MTAVRGLRHYVSIYLRFLVLRLQAQAEYRVDALLLAGSALLGESLGLVFIWAIYQQIPSIRGWTAPQVLLLYGLVVLSAGIMQTFFEGIWMISYEVYRGDFDTYLARPVPVLLSVLTAWTSPEGIGAIALGLGLCSFALAKIDISWHPTLIVTGAVLVISGIAVRAALTLIVNSLTFWASGPLEVGDASEPVYELGRFPLQVYAAVLRVTMVTIVPVAFVSILPATYLIRGYRGAPWALLGPLVAALFWAVGLWIFKRGVRGYSSTGA